MESELFGHIKGSFTGANDNRKGYFEEADGGTIFLDEVGELSAESQKRLLRVLESGEFYKVGSSTVQKTDVRVIAATNVDLQEAIRQRRFREDLFYRLNQVPIYLPPLRERKSDILMLFRKFASDCADRYNLAPVSLDKDAQSILISYRWPGNIRQLKNIVDQITILEPSRQINSATIKKYLPFYGEDLHPVDLAQDDFFGGDKKMIIKMILTLKQEVDELKNKISAQTPMPNIQVAVQPVDQTPDDAVFTETVEPEPVAESIDNHSLQAMEEKMIREVLNKYPRNRKAAAKELKISERTLYRKIKEYGIQNERKKKQ